MDQTLARHYARDRDVWNECAPVYERQVVAGHPDIAAYEAFEEDFLDALLCHLAATQPRPIMLYDIGCGSGRLHLRYGRLLASGASVLAERLASVGGLDFSAEMIALARRKLAENDLASLEPDQLWFVEGSAFELEPMPDAQLPVLVSLCNSVGVMQGPAGAASLFQSMRRAVEQAGGIALISAYRRRAVPTHALGNYESTMDVSGQPRWLTPDDYASGEYVQVPRAYKRAYDPTPTIDVDVFTRSMEPVCPGHRLERDPDAVAEVVRTGHIQTYSDYESRWYSFEQFDRWIEAHWCGAPSYHLAGASLDVLRAAPAQFALFDAGGRLREFFKARLGSEFGPVG